jgi:16S rRNA (guanine966-N2)-methyltransferase
MRVITGSARGRVLLTVDGTDVRPTAAKVKEAVFSAIQFEIEGARVLDLFCGSGQMGIEALSRGASLCVFVDVDHRSHETTKKNLAATGLFQKARVVKMDYLAYLQGAKDTFDFIFLDPPYSRGYLQQALPLLPRIVSDAGVIFCEHEETDLLPDTVGGFIRVKKYRYGRISVSAYRKQV